MAPTPTSNPSSSSSSSHPQPPIPDPHQPHPRLNLPNRLVKFSSCSLAPKINTFPGAPFFISGNASTTPHHVQDTTCHGWKVPVVDLNVPSGDMDVDGQDMIIPPKIRLTKLKQLARAKKVKGTTSPGRKIARFDLNFAPTEMDVDGQGNIPRKISPTKLKQLARAKKVKLENPDQKEDRKNELKEDRAGSEENVDQQQLDAPCQSNSSSTVCRKRNRCPIRNRISDSENGRTCHQVIYSWFSPISILFENHSDNGFGFFISNDVDGPSPYSAIKRLWILLLHAKVREKNALQKSVFRQVFLE